MANLEGVLANTTAGTFTVTLPATPATGNQCVIADATASFGTTNLTVGRNGSTINGTAEDLTLDISGVSVQFIYNGTTWDVFTQVGGNGGTAMTLNGTETATNKTFTTGNAFNGTLGATTASTVAATTISATGLVDLSSATAGQVKFPATQNASSNANTLDDYKEGTFTPDLYNAGASSTWTQKNGRYTKIGNLVYITLNFDSGTSGGGGGSLTVSGLPYALAGNGNMPTIIGFTGNASPAGYYTCRMANAATTCIITNSAGTQNNTTETFCSIVMMYFTA
jgi:hypothetical protein